MKRRLDWQLLIVSILSLVIGSVLHLTNYPMLAEITWAIGGVAGLVPSIVWFVESLLHHQMGSDVLAIFSLVGTLMTQNMLAAAIISLMLSTGRVLENWADGQAERQLKLLLSRVPRISHIINTDGSLTEIPVDAIKSGDRLLVKSGEITPVDGQLLTSALLDESALTGEPLPVSRVTTELVASGVLNAASKFEMVATSSAEMSTYAGIIRLVKQAQANTSPAVRLANIWAIRFVPLAILMSLGTLLITHSIDRMVAVLVTATPCPLILAVPIAVVSGMSRAAKMGVIIKGGANLELLATADVVMLDKTGTLTQGGPAITSIMCSALYTPEEVLQIAAAIDQYSNHVVAKAIIAAAKKRKLVIKPATNLLEEHGVGITGEINGDRFTIGQFTETPNWLSITYPLMVGVKAEGILIGVLGLADPIRDEAAALMLALKAAGITKTFLVTGDRLESAQLVADQIGIKYVYASMSAQGKLDLVEATKATTRGSVIFVGDGINDAPALAAANVGVAMGARGATAASESADVVIVEDSIIKVANVIEVAKFAHQKALQSAQIGMGLSLLAMLAASLGFLTSAVGAGVQEIIDIVAILWALTTLNFKAL